MSVCPWNVRMIQTANLGAGRMAPAHRSRTTRRSQTRRMSRWMVNRWWLDGKNHQFIMVDICYYLLILILWLLPWFSTSCHLYPLVTNVTHLETMFNNECHLITSSVNPSWTLVPWIPQPSKTGFTRSSPTKCNPRWQCRSWRGAWEEIGDPRKPRNMEITVKKNGT